MCIRDRSKGEAKSIGLLGNAADIFSELVTRGIVPDVVTDQTSAHDPLMGYIPAGYTPQSAADLREQDWQGYQRTGKSMRISCNHTRSLPRHAPAAPNATAHGQPIMGRHAPPR